MKTTNLISSYPHDSSHEVPKVNHSEIRKEKEEKALTFILEKGMQFGVLNLRLIGQLLLNKDIREMAEAMTAAELLLMLLTLLYFISLP